MVLTDSKELSLPGIKLYAKKKFNPRDLGAFAALTGDQNPIHMDALVARRAFEGSRVVHGVLVLLHGLDQWARVQKKWPVQRIKCDFKKPVLLDESVEYVWGETGTGSIRIRALVDEVVCAEIELFGEMGNGSSLLPSRGGHEPLDALKSPLEWDPSSGNKLSGTLSNPPNALLKKHFPDLCRWLPASKASALSRLSYIVGMICPGLYSLFASLDISLTDDSPSPGLTLFSIHHYDDRFHQVEIQVSGEWGGTVKAFLRPKPYQQPGMESIRGLVVPEEFLSARALVIGGSRGLGELTAKLLCSGGARVTLGYRAGKEEALRIKDEISKSGLGSCQPLQVDILKPPSKTFIEALSGINGLYYFPTPVIFKKESRLFVKKHFDDFIDYYVDRFYAVCLALENNSANKVQVFFPSTVFIDQRPNGMTGYAMAKAAAEILIQDINRSFKKVNVVSARLPRLGSDQTNSIFETKKEDGISVLLPILRSIQSRLNE